MANIFERLAKASRSTVERVHGKDVTIFPLAASQDPNAKPRRAGADASYSTSACFFENTLIESDAKAQPLTGAGRLAHRSLQMQASIRLVEGKAFAAGYFLRREDDGALFTITRFDPDGLGQVLATLAVAQSLPEV